MCVGGGAPSIPTPPPPKAPVKQAEAPSVSIKQARDQARKDRQNKAGIAAFNKTGPGGVNTPATIGTKSLLGA